MVMKSKISFKSLFTFYLPIISFLKLLDLNYLVAQADIKCSIEGFCAKAFEFDTTKGVTSTTEVSFELIKTSEATVYKSDLKHLTCIKGTETSSECLADIPNIKSTLGNGSSDTKKSLIFAIPNPEITDFEKGYTLKVNKLYKLADNTDLITPASINTNVKYDLDYTLIIEPLKPFIEVSSSNDSKLNYEFEIVLGTTFTSTSIDFLTSKNIKKNIPLTNSKNYFTVSSSTGNTIDTFNSSTNLYELRFEKRKVFISDKSTQFYGLALIINSDKYDYSEVIKSEYSFYIPPTVVNFNEVLTFIDGGDTVTFTMLQTFPKTDKFVAYIGSKEFETSKQNICDFLTPNTDTHILTCKLSEIRTDITNPIQASGGRLAKVVSDVRTYKSTILSVSKSVNQNFGTASDITNDVFVMEFDYCPLVGGMHKFIFNGALSFTLKCKFTGDTLSEIYAFTTSAKKLFTFGSSYYSLDKGSCYNCEVSFTNKYNSNFYLSTIVCPLGDGSSCDTSISLHTDSTSLTYYQKIMIFQFYFIKVDSTNNLDSKFKVDSTYYSIPKGEITDVIFYKFLISTKKQFYGNIRIESQIEENLPTFYVTIFNFNTKVNFVIDDTNENNLKQIKVIKGFNEFYYYKKLDENMIKNTLKSNELQVELYINNNKAISTNPMYLNIIPENIFPTVNSTTISESNSMILTDISESLFKSSEKLTTDDTDPLIPLIKELFDDTKSLGPIDNINEDIRLAFGGKYLTNCVIIGSQFQCPKPTDNELFNNKTANFTLIPEVITKYGRLKSDKEALCNSTVGNFSSYPFYSCNCTKYKNYISNTCVENCPNTLGAKVNTTVCNYCESGFKAESNNCTQKCSSGKVPKKIPNTNAYYCDYCDNKTDGGSIAQNEVCVNNCSEGYGLNPDTKECVNCASIGKYSQNYVCTDKCTADTYRSEIKSGSVSIHSCKKCTDKVNYLPQWDKCVSNCTDGYQFTKANTTSIQIDHCFPCSYNNTYFWQGNCSLKVCNEWQKKFELPNYCSFCKENEAVYNNTCFSSCPTNSSITNSVRNSSVSTIYTTCKDCKSDEYLVTQMCKENDSRCKNQTGILKSIRTCMTECPANTIKNSTSRTCSECTSPTPVILDNHCDVECKSYQILDPVDNRCKYCDNIFSNGKCIDSCPSLYIPQLVAGQTFECIACKDHETHNIEFGNTCVASCLLPKFYYLEIVGGKKQCKKIETTSECIDSIFCMNGGKCKGSKIFECTCSDKFVGKQCELSLSKGIDYFKSIIENGLDEYCVYLDNPMTGVENQKFINKIQELMSILVAIVNKLVSTDVIVKKATDCYLKAFNNKLTEEQIAEFYDTLYKQSLEGSSTTKRSLKAVYVADITVRSNMYDFIMTLNSGAKELVSKQVINTAQTNIKNSILDLEFSDLNELSSQIENGILFYGISSLIQIGKVKGKRRELQTISDKDKSIFDFSNCTFKTSNSDYKLNTRILEDENSEEDNLLRSLAGLTSTTSPTTTSSTSPTSTSTTSTTSSLSSTSGSFIADPNTVWFVINSNFGSKDNATVAGKGETINGYSEFNQITFLHDNSRSKYSTSTPNSAKITAECPNGFAAKYPIRKSGLDFDSYDLYTKSGVNIFKRNDKLFGTCQNFTDNIYADLPNPLKFQKFNSFIYCGNSGCTFDRIDDNSHVVCTCKGNVGTDSYFNYYTAYDISTINVNKTISNLAFFKCVGTGFKNGIGSNYGFIALILILVFTIISVGFAIFFPVNLEDISKHPGPVGKANNKKVGATANNIKIISDIENDDVIAIDKKSENENSIYSRLPIQGSNYNSDRIEKNVMEGASFSTSVIPKFEVKSKIDQPLIFTNIAKVGAKEDKSKIKSSYDEVINLQDETDNFSQINNRIINNYMHSADKPNIVGDQTDVLGKRNLLANNTKKGRNKDKGHDGNQDEINTVDKYTNKEESDDSNKNSFFSIFLQELFNNHLLIRPFLCKSIAKSKTIMAFNLCLTYSLMFLVSGMTYTDKFIYKLYIFKTLAKIPSANISYIFKAELLRVILTLFVPIIVGFILSLITIVPQNLYVEYKSITTRGQGVSALKDFKKRFDREMSGKTGFFIFIVLVIYILSFIYCVGFCGVYLKTSKEFAITAAVCFCFHTLLIQPIWILIKSSFKTFSKGEK